MVKIISDSTCDLSLELMEMYDIDIIPLHILMDDKEYEDGTSFSPEMIYEWSDRTKETPKTSAPSLERAVEIMRPFVEKGNEIICFSISGDMSTSGNVMRLAAAELEAEEKITVIDSMNLSTGIGLLVLEAAELAKEGKTASEIVKDIESMIPKVRASFVVDTLTFLYRGGRCSGLSALVGSALKLHPRIYVEHGKMAVGKKYRGNLKKVLLAYAKDMEEDMRKAKRKRVFITHSGCKEEEVKVVCDYLDSLQIFEEILITRAGGVISSHCGPGTLGVLFLSE